MVIRIDKLTSGRFGNRILQYTSLVLLGNKYNVKCSMVQNNEITDYFQSIIPFMSSKKPIKLLTCKMILDDEPLDFEKYEYKIDDPSNSLHNVFYKLASTDPRTFIELKDKFKIKLPNDIINIGIHIRGGDIISKDGNNGREIHEFEYYKNATEYVLKTLCKDKKYYFYICTDDINFKTFQQCWNYFKNLNIPLVFRSKNNYIEDWSILNSCDILINSSSTFCVTAGYLNKKTPKIIHSKKWIDKNINYEPWNNVGNKELYPGYKITDFRKNFDDFWINVPKNNDYYSSYKII